MVWDTDVSGHRNESIFWLNRGLYKEIDKVATILSSLGRLSFRPGMQYESEGGEDAAIEEMENPFTSGAITAVEKGGGYKPMPITDIHSAMRLWYHMLMSRLQRGGLPSINFGNLTFPLSAVAIMSLKEQSDPIYIPRLQAISSLQQQRFRMVLRQMKMIGLPLKLGEKGREREYTYKELEGEYSVKFRYSNQAPQLLAANYTLASVAKSVGMPQGWVLENIIQVDDPEKIMRRWKIEEAERLDPVIKLHRVGHSLIEEADLTGNDSLRLEAQIIANREKNMILAASRGEVEPGAKEEPGMRPESVIPLLQRGAGGPRREPTTFRPEDEENNEEV
jgi:hypothetical protein